MNNNFAKIVALGLVAGVAKALFRPASIHTHNHYPEAPKDLDTQKEDS